MSDRYRGYPPLSGRSAAAFNPARVSLANSLSTYGPAPISSYAAATDADFVASPQRYTSIPRGYHPSAGSASGSPAPTSRTYPMSPEARPPSRPANRESNRSRRSTLDAVARPPIIVTSTSIQDHHHHLHNHHNHPHSAAAHSSAAAHAASPSAHSPSPVRDAPYRASDGKLYAQPASTVRSRSANRPYHASSLSEDYARPRQPDLTLALATRDADTYRSSRPSVHYPSDPRHSNAAIDYGDDGYQYTNAGELVKYDLDHPAAAAAAAGGPPHPRSRRHERHESFDRGYHRPNINYNADQRSFNVKTGHELSRHYSVSSRPYDTRGGPPPSTRGFDKINRGLESIPPSLAPLPAPPPSAPLDASSAGALVRRDSRRARPVSLTQEIGGSRTAHPEDYYRGHLPDDAHKYPRYYDDVGTHQRGFDVRASPPQVPDERQSRYREPKREEAALDDLDWDHPHREEPRREEPRQEKPRQSSLKGSDDDDNDDDDDLRGSDADRDERYRSSYKVDTRRPSEGGSDAARPIPSFREKISAGFGMAASAVGFGSSAKRDEKKAAPREGKEKEPPRRHSLGHSGGGGGGGGDDDDDDDNCDDDVHDDVHDDARDPQDEADAHGRMHYTEDGHEREPERNGDMARKSDADLGERRRREAQAKLEGEAVASESESDGSGKAPSIAASVRRRASNASIANSTADPKQVMQQADADAARAGEKESGGPGEDGRPEEDSRGREPSRSPERVRSVSPAGTDPDLVDETPTEENRGRDLVVHSDFKQVRVVSPPREKKEGKPLKGILKQPKPSFPEERNPIREGVAPHKDDKKLKEVPLGAKWTKINRKIVNPEALEIGKERYEVRDDFVIVLRVLSKEEIQTYASATQVLRERRRNKENGDRGHDRERERDRDHDRSYDDYDDQQYDDNADRREATQHHHRARQRVDEGASAQEEWAEDRERDRRRRSRKDEEEYSSRPRDAEHRHHRSQRDRA